MTAVAPPKLVFHRVDREAPEIAPGEGRRAWMDATNQRFAYRCLPLTIANATGWEVRCPSGFDAFWNGGERTDDIRLQGHDSEMPIGHWVGSHFGHGVLTFHTGYLVRTEPGWATLVRGAPNWPKDGIAALEGMVETDWLPFPFTMNWHFTRPGKVTFRKDEPFCFVLPIPHLAYDGAKPEIRAIADDPALLAEYREWALSRDTFNAALAKGDPAAEKEAWQRMYVRGRTALGTPAGETHRSKRRLPAAAATGSLAGLCPRAPALVPGPEDAGAAVWHEEP